MEQVTFLEGPHQYHTVVLEDATTNIYYGGELYRRVRGTHYYVLREC